jgi:hypothetical protein
VSQAGCTNEGTVSDNQPDGVGSETTQQKVLARVVPAPGFTDVPELAIDQFSLTYVKAAGRTKSGADWKLGSAPPIGIG